MTNTIVQKIWNFCNTLRDDGLGYNDYLEQLTYLLFLKMADENKEKYDLPVICNWQELVKNDGGDLLYNYEQILKSLASSGGMLEKIFIGAQNKVNDSSKLRKLIHLINEDNWSSTGVDVKGEIYEGLLQKNAENSGAGQYFTPRSIIQTIVECINPKIGETIADPSCGTGGFFLGALEHLKKALQKTNDSDSDFLKFRTFYGWEIERATARLCLMNLYLHGIGDLKNTPDIQVSDSLKERSPYKVKLVLANPPFGKSSSDIPTNDNELGKKEGYIYRKEFWTTTSNKQLSFLQHIYNMLEDQGGKAAVVLPDNVLFEGGAGEIIRRKLLEKTNLHTILRLPTGIFYAHGVKANVLFFDKNISDIPLTKSIWVYDYRTNIHHTLKKNSLKLDDLREFIKCYNSSNIEDRVETWSENNPEGRWRKYEYDDIIASDKTSLDITWLEDNSFTDLNNFYEPDILAHEIIENLEAGLESFKSILITLKV